MRASTAPSYAVRTVVRRTHDYGLRAGTVRPQGLAEPCPVVGDQPGGGAEYVSGGTVVLLQPDCPGAVEILLETEDVGDLGSPPAVDGLVVVADAADVPVALGEQTNPKVLCDVGVLVLVHRQVAELPLVVIEDAGRLPEQRQVVEQEIPEIHRIQGCKALLVGLVQSAPLPVREAADMRLRHLFRPPALVLPPLDDHRELPCRPAPVAAGHFGVDHLLEQADLIVRIKDRKGASEAGRFRVPPQDAQSERVEGAEPQAIHGRGSDERLDARAHLAGRLVGEGHGEGLAGPCPSGRQDVDEARRQHPRLSGPGAGKHKQRPVQRLDGPPLGRIQSGEIGRLGPNGREGLGIEGERIIHGCGPYHVSPDGGAVPGASLII